LADSIGLKLAGFGSSSLAAFSFCCRFTFLLFAAIADEKHDT
tara:strand:- start:515 stop:640 length:126 start_codon:yes stop_codon:yes gene_type:complete